MKTLSRDTILFIFIIVTIILAVKGQIGNPIYYQKPTEHNTQPGSPFESTNSTARYALTQSIVENGTLFFDEKQARFAAPDVVRYKNRFFSIFTPGVSFFGVPFYIIGKFFGIPQLASYLSVTLMALVNMVLVAMLAHRFSASWKIAYICGMIFLFGTNALAYGLTYTQHHGSTMIILLALINAQSAKRTIANNFIFGFLSAAAILFDIPNFFIMLPIGIYVIAKHFVVKNMDKKITISFNFLIVTILAGILPLLVLYGWYNKTLTGSYTLIGQTIGRTTELNVNKPESHQIKGKEDDPFERKQVLNTRKQLNGLYILLVSDERSWLYYSPVVLLGVLGWIVAYRRKDNRTILVVTASVVLMNILTYSMFGDPWGGWSFGSRYLIPAAAILCVYISALIKTYKKNWLFISLFAGLVIYSVYISSLGALTTAAIPPKNETKFLETHLPHTYQYNVDLANENRSSSLLYNLYFVNHISLKDYVKYYAFLPIAIITLLYFSFYKQKVKQL